MWIKVVGRPVPNVGKAGDVKNVDRNSAKVLVALGRAEYAEKPGRKRRTYRRRDIVAEPVFAAEPVIEDVFADEPEILDEEDDEDHQHESTE